MGGDAPVSDLKTFKLTPEGVTEAMRTLDLESWEIAEKLRELGVKGVEGNECACPIAVYLTKVLPGIDEVFVESEVARITFTQQDEYGFEWPGVTISAGLPDGAQDFIPAFDMGEYPDLIASVDLAPEGEEQ